METKKGRARGKERELNDNYMISIESERVREWYIDECLDLTSCLSPPAV